MKPKHLLASIGTLLTLLGSAQAVADITLGIFPRRPVAATHKAFKPLREHLEKSRRGVAPHNGHEVCPCLGESMHCRVAEEDMG